MKLPAAGDYATPQELLDALGSYIDAADGMLARGEHLELAGLDAVVASLCARVLKLTPEEGREFAEPLDALYARLGALQENMLAARQSIEDEINTVNARQRAARAYRKEE